MHWNKNKSMKKTFQWIGIITLDGVLDSEYFHKRKSVNSGEVLKAFVLSYTLRHFMFHVNCRKITKYTPNY